MEKKIFALITALLVVCSLCLALVACDDNDGNSNGIKLSDKMSKEEIIEKLDDISSFTVELYMGSGYGTYYFGNDWSYMESNDGKENGAGSKDIMIIEDGRVYAFTIFCEGNNEWEEEQYVVSDDEETIAEYREELADIRDEYRQEFIDMINADKYTIVNGNLKFTIEYEGEEESGEGYILLRDVNATKIPTLPEQYKDYKNFDLTADEDVE